ncbi:MAG TPA: hypothetical protein DIU37_05390 [Opitutae bacterium]|nr:hypothetical protein [Opitutae bacterium]
MEMNLRVYVCWMLMFVGGALCLSAQGGNFSAVLGGWSLGDESTQGESTEEAVTGDNFAVPARTEFSMTSDHFWPCFEFYWGMQAWANLWLNYGNTFAHPFQGYAPFAEEMYWTLGYVMASLGKLPNTGLVYYLNMYLVEVRRHLWRLAGKMPESTYREYYNSNDAVNRAVDVLFEALSRCLQGDALRRLGEIRQAVHLYQGDLGDAMRADTSLYGSVVFAYLLKELAVLVLDLIPEWQEVMLGVFGQGENTIQERITQLRNRIAEQRYAEVFRRNLFNYIYYRVLLLEMRGPFGLGEEWDARMSEIWPWMRLAAEALAYPADQGRMYGVGLPPQEVHRLRFDPDDSEVHSEDDDAGVSYLGDDDDGAENERETDDNGQGTLITQQQNNTAGSVINARNAFYGAPVWLNVALYDGGGCQQ